MAHQKHWWKCHHITATADALAKPMYNLCKETFFSTIFNWEVKNNEIKCAKPSSATNAAALPDSHFNIFFSCERSTFFPHVFSICVVSSVNVYVTGQEQYFHIPRTHKSTPNTNAHCFEWLWEEKIIGEKVANRLKHPWKWHRARVSWHWANEHTKGEMGREKKRKKTANPEKREYWLFYLKVLFVVTLFCW